MESHYTFFVAVKEPLTHSMVISCGRHGLISHFNQT